MLLRVERDSLLHFTVVVQCATHSDSCCKPMTVAVPCQCAAESRFAFSLFLQQYTTSPTWKSCRAGSAPCARDLASTARDKARSYLSEMIDLCAADTIAMRSENVLSRVTRSCKEISLPLVQQRVRQLRSSSENPLRRRASAVILGRIAGPGYSGSEPCHAVHLFSNKLDAELVDQPSCMFPQTPPCRSQTVLCCGVMAAVGMSSQPKSSSSCPNSRSNGCSVTELSVCAKSCGQMARMVLTLAHIASQLQCCANSSCATTSDTFSSCECMDPDVCVFGEDLQSVSAPPQWSDQAPAGLRVELEFAWQEVLVVVFGLEQF